MRDSVEAVYELVKGIVPVDQLEQDHIVDTLEWLERTDDVFRRSKPALPPRHLVSYVALLDHRNSEILLVDHVNAGLFLPPGGHVEPDEHPLATARRECREELGIEASFPGHRPKPAFVTVTRTVGADNGHTDVSLWFISEGWRGMQLSLDEVEFRSARWWSRGEITAAGKEQFDPHLERFLAKALVGGWPSRVEM
jgi:8-oxo-dGTP diphosphatase